MPKSTKTLSPNELEKGINEFESSGAKRKKIAVGGESDLYLILLRTKTGVSKRWEVRCRVNGTDYHRSLNGKTYAKKGEKKSKSYCGLSKARDLARDYIRSLTAGVDPLIEAKKAKEEKQKKLSFKECALAYIAVNSESWARNNKLREKRTLESLTRRAFPVFGDVPIDEVSADHVFEALMREEWVLNVKQSTSRQFRDHVNAVCEWAKGKRYRPDGLSSPAVMTKGSRLSVLLAPYSNLIPKDGNNATIDYRDAPTFFAELCGLNRSNGRDALIFGMLTALRGGSYRSLRWCDIDFENQICTVTEGGRKKKGDGVFTAYLSPYAVAFLKTLPRWSGEYVFSANDGRDEITQTTLAHTIRTMNVKRRARGLKEWRDWSMPNDDGTFPVVKPHAICRTAFTTWSDEDEHGNDQIISFTAVELTLDHDKKRARNDNHKGAYRRNDKRQSRINALTWWGRFLTTGKYPDEEDGKECEEWLAIVGSQSY